MSLSSHQCTHQWNFCHIHSPAQIQCDELTMQHTPWGFPGIGLFLLTCRSGSWCTPHKHQHTFQSVNPLHSPLLHGNCALWLAMFHQSSLRYQAHHHLTVKYQNVQHALCAQIAVSEKAPAVQVDLAVYTGHWLSGGRCSAVLVDLSMFSQKLFNTDAPKPHTMEENIICWSQKIRHPLHLWKLDTVCIVCSHALQYRGINS